MRPAKKAPSTDGGQTNLLFERQTNARPVPPAAAEAPLAVVTGASGGLGRELARRLSARGYRLLLVGRRLEALRGEFPAAEIRAADLSRPVETEALAAELCALGAEVLVNCAGLGRAGESAALGAAEEQELFVNALAPQLLTRAFLRAVSAGRKGYVLNVCSVSAFAPAPLLAGYAASKAYLYSYTRAVAEELRGARQREKKGRRGAKARTREPRGSVGSEDARGGAGRAFVCAGCPGPLDTPFDERAGMGKRRGMDPGRCAQKLLATLFAGRPLAVPGCGAKAYRLACRLLPVGLLARLSHRYRRRLL